MALIKCPRCELNYMQSTDKVCAVCRREMHGEDDRDTIELCSNCGERPVVPGEEFCLICLKETKRGEAFDDDGVGETAGSETLGLTDASEMDEIEIDLGEDTDNDNEYKTIKDELDEDEDFVSLEEMRDEEDEDDEEEDQ